MRTIDAVFGKKIPLSKTGTNDTTTVRFDVKAWQDAYPECTITLIHKRPVDPAGLPVNVLPVVDGKALWLVSNADTHYAGDGECELVMNKGQANAKSVTYYTEITESVGSQEEDPPEPYQGFVDYVAQKASEATTAKNDAVTAKDSAIEASERAEAAAEYIEESAEQIAENKENIEALQETVSGHTTQIAQNATDISTLNTTVEELDEKVDENADAIESLESGKVDEPSTEGTSGQVLTTDGNGGRTWTTVATDISGKMDKQNPVGYNNLNVGANNTLSGYNLVALGSGNSVQGNGSGAFGIGNTVTYGEESFAFGHYNTSNSYYTFVEGFENSAQAQYAHAEGYGTTASGSASHSEGYSSDATGSASHAEGYNTTASGDRSHAEGSGTSANGAESHAEGTGTSAEGSDSHSEGYGTTASGSSSHAEGNNTVASGIASHAEGYNTTAQGVMNHAEGYETQANGNYQHVQGAYNIKDTQGKYADIIGGGDNIARKNIETVDWSGNMELAGDLSINACGGANPVQVGTKLSSHDTSISTLNTSVVSLNQAIGTLEDSVETKADKTALAKTDRSLDALWKLNEGISYEFEEQTETGMNVAPIGSFSMTLENVQGKSEQFTTSGANLLAYPYFDTTKTVKGITYTDNGDGSVTINGTSTGDSTFGFNQTASRKIINMGACSLKWFNTYYTDYGVNFQADIYDSNGNYVSTTQQETTWVYSDAYSYGTARIRILEGVTVNNLTVYPMLCLSTATTYEPYTGGIPSPSPDFPQEIHSVEEINIVVKDADGEIVTERTITPPAPLNKIGDYKDVADVESGKWKYVLLKKRILGSGSWSHSSATNRFYRNDPDFEMPVNARVMPTVLCTHFKPTVNYDELTNNTIQYINDTNHGFAYRRTEFNGDLATFASFLTNNNVYVVGKANTPTQQDISSADLAFLRSLENIPADHHIFVTDQDGNDVSYLLEYIISLREVN